MLVRSEEQYYLGCLGHALRPRTTNADWLLVADPSTGVKLLGNFVLPIRIKDGSLRECVGCAPQVLRFIA